jgi:hypothetical protein
MNSAKSSTLLDFEVDVRTSQEDVLALRRARRGARMSLDEYLNFLRQFDDPSAAVLRARRGPRGDGPFEL